MGLKEDFEEHAEKAKTLPESTSNENKLILYGLYKQATVGDVNTSRPGIFDMKGKAKWDAWKALEGKSADEAMNDYITKVKQLLEEADCKATSFFPASAARCWSLIASSRYSVCLCVLNSELKDVSHGSLPCCII
ncbi:hypothetical protein V2J09_014763 [Rumex salicifolius]